MRDLNLKPEYSSSHALIVGIDDYKHASPLRNAVEDANAVADALKKSFSFPAGQVTIFLNERATKNSILSAYLAYEKIADPDSRLLVFFAGHGFTKSVRNGEAGFLVPHEGNLEDLSTLIRWEELTRNADLIPAKHIFYVMDACYGGLIFNRAVSAGSVRFLKDLIIRPARQALAAGKDDQLVSDGGGPRPKHSIFTGHFLDALDGAARAKEGHLTANAVMSYVYKQVGNDIHSEQTPQYGFLSGDGDFIFDAPQLKALGTSDTSETDKLVTVSSLEIPQQEQFSVDPFETAKQYVSDPKYVIQLHDLLMQNVRRVIVETANEKFPVRGAEFSTDEFLRRLQSCETATQNLRRMLVCVAYWGTYIHRPLLSKTISRVTDHLDVEGGLTIWNSLRWYPSIVLCYATGIAAIANERYENLQAVFGAAVESRRNATNTEFVATLCDEILEIERSNAFKMLPGHERYYTPRSEYLFKLLQPELDDDLFLGKEYEVTFDHFEIYLALACACNRKRNQRGIWGPYGRFVWKSKGMVSRNVLAEVFKAAETEKTDWPPFKAGLFGSDFNIFMDVTKEYLGHVAQTPWF